MAYITNTDIETRLGTATYLQLTDDDANGTADAARVDEARLGAEGETDSYLATRYAVPLNLSGEPQLAAVIKSFVLDLAVYRLHSRRTPIPADVVRRRDEAVNWLNRVALGYVQLPSALAVRENPALGSTPRAAGPQRSMTRETLENF